MKNIIKSLLKLQFPENTKFLINFQITKSWLKFLRRLYKLRLSYFYQSNTKFGQSDFQDKNLSFESQFEKNITELKKVDQSQINSTKKIIMIDTAQDKKDFTIQPDLKAEVQQVKTQEVKREDPKQKLCAYEDSQNIELEGLEKRQEQKTENEYNEEMQHEDQQESQNILPNENVDKIQQKVIENVYRKKSELLTNLKLKTYDQEDDEQPEFLKRTLQHESNSKQIMFQSIEATKEITFQALENSNKIDKNEQILEDSSKLDGQLKYFQDERHPIKENNKTEEQQKEDIQLTNDQLNDNHVEIQKEQNNGKTDNNCNKQNAKEKQDVNNFIEKSQQKKQNYSSEKYEQKLREKQQSKIHDSSFSDNKEKDKVEVNLNNQIQTNQQEIIDQQDNNHTQFNIQINKQKQCDKEQLSEEQNQVTEEQNQVTEEQNQVTEEQNQVTEEQNQVTEEQNQVTEEQNQVTEEQNQVTEEQNQVTEEQNQVTEEQNQVTEEQNQVTEEQNQVTEEQNQVTEEQKQVTEEQNQVTEEQNQVTEEQNQVTEEQNQVTEEQNQVTEEQNQVTEEQNQVTEEQNQVTEEQKHIKLITELNDTTNQVEIQQERSQEPRHSHSQSIQQNKEIIQIPIQKYELIPEYPDAPKIESQVFLGEMLNRQTNQNNQQKIINSNENDRQIETLQKEEQLRNIEQSIGQEQKEDEEKNSSIQPVDKFHQQQSEHEQPNLNIVKKLQSPQKKHTHQNNFEQFQQEPSKSVSKGSKQPQNAPVIPSNMPAISQKPTLQNKSLHSIVLNIHKSQGTIKQAPIYRPRHRSQHKQKKGMIAPNLKRLQHNVRLESKVLNITVSQKSQRQKVKNQEMKMILLRQIQQLKSQIQLYETEYDKGADPMPNNDIRQNHKNQQTNSKSYLQKISYSLPMKSNYGNQMFEHVNSSFQNNSSFRNETSRNQPAINKFVQNGESKNHSSEDPTTFKIKRKSFRTPKLQKVLPDEQVNYDSQRKDQSMMSNLESDHERSIIKDPLISSFIRQEQNISPVKNHRISGKIYRTSQKDALMRSRISIDSKKSKASEGLGSKTLEGFGNKINETNMPQKINSSQQVNRQSKQGSKQSIQANGETKVQDKGLDSARKSYVIKSRVRGMSKSKMAGSIVNLKQAVVNVQVNDSEVDTPKVEQLEMNEVPESYKREISYEVLRQLECKVLLPMIQSQLEQISLQSLTNILPSPTSSQQELVHFAYKCFLKFGINIKSHQILLNIKKYKNCILFALNEKDNLLYYFGGRYYFGGWKGSVKEDWGFENGEKGIYKGQFSSNVKNGVGMVKMVKDQKGDTILHNANQIIPLNNRRTVFYMGQWRNNTKQGQGIQYQFTSTRILEYRGEFKNSKKNGHGTLSIYRKQTYQLLQKYEGQFSNGYKHGHGHEWFQNGDQYYGHYTNNKFEGLGVYWWKGGAVYRGEFSNGVREGKGEWVAQWKIDQEMTLKKLLESQLKMNEMVGELQTDYYRGEYRNNQKNGFGVYRWKNGVIYQGQFLDDVKQGQGLVFSGQGLQVKAKNIPLKC